MAFIPFFHYFGHSLSFFILLPQKLKSDLNAAERSMEELMDVRRKEQVCIKTFINNMAVDSTNNYDC